MTTGTSTAWRGRVGASALPARPTWSPTARNPATAVAPRPVMWGGGEGDGGSSLSSHQRGCDRSSSLHVSCFCKPLSYTFRCFGWDDKGPAFSMALPSVTP